MSGELGGGRPAVSAQDGRWDVQRGERNKGAARYQTALGSMRETLSCIEVGVALGYVVRVDAEVEARIRRIIGTLVRLIGR